MTTARKLFVNLPVRDLQKSRAFFAGLGFAFNEQFTGDDAACLILSDEAQIMLLAEKRFQDFTDRQVCDTRTHTEALFSVSATSRAEVDELVRKAIAAGGIQAEDPQDHGFMYGWSFYDLDGHGWQVMWMDPAQIPAA
jgi:predicted lactoylglutathione lyase